MTERGRGGGGGEVVVVVGTGGVVVAVVGVGGTGDGAMLPAERRRLSMCDMPRPEGVGMEEAGWIDAVIIFGRLLRRWWATPGDGGCGGEFEGESSRSATVIEVLRGLPLRNDPRIVVRVFELRGGDSSRDSMVVVSENWKSIRRST